MLILFIFGDDIMAVPRKAILETVLPGGIAIYDVSDILPKPENPRYNVRPNGTEIVRVFFHHSGAYGRDGFEGALGSVRYVIQNRNFGARPYHFWLAYKPDVDENGNIVIYRLGKDSERCWHTGAKANDNGVGVSWQGNLHPDGTGEPSVEQYKMAEALTKWLIERYKLSLPNGLSFHAEAKKWGARKNKSSCPGPFVEEWVKERRNRTEKPVEEKKDNTDKSQDDLNETKNKEEKNKKVPKIKNKSWCEKLKDTWLANLFPGKKDE